MPSENRPTGVPFAADEAAKIREAIVTPGARIVCPRCGGALTPGTPIAGGGSITAVWELRCDHCQRIVLVRDLPAGP